MKKVDTPAPAVGTIPAVDSQLAVAEPPKLVTIVTNTPSPSTPNSAKSVTLARGAAAGVLVHELALLLRMNSRAFALWHRLSEWASSHRLLVGAALLALAVFGGAPTGLAARTWFARHKIFGLGVILCLACLVVPLFCPGLAWPWRWAIAAGLGAVANLSLSAAQRRPAEHTASGLDDPIQTESEDLLRRQGTASELARLVTAPRVRCPRIALTAPVGAGKSSVANLCRRALESDGHTVVRFDPWYFANVDDARRGLVATIDGALVKGSRRLQLHGRARRWLAAIARSVLGEYKWAEPLRLPVEAALDVGKADLARAITEALPKGKRLIVLVEDLERADPAQTAALLMTTREMLDADGLAFLFAFDGLLVHERLRDAKLAKANENAREHFDKIFDHVLPLPDADPETLGGYRRETMARLGVPDGLAQVTLSNAPLLPVHPREFKRFVFSLVNGAAQIGRAPPELNTKTLFLMALLEYRCPGALRWISAGPDRIRDFTVGALVERLDQRAGRAPNSRVQDAPWLVEGASDAAQVYLALREAGGFNGERHLTWMLGQWSTPVTQLVTELRQLVAIEGANVESLVRSALKGSETPDIRVTHLAEALGIAKNAVLQELQQEGSAARADELSRQVRLLARSEGAIAERFAQPAGVPAAFFGKAWSSFCALQGWGGRFTGVAQEMFTALQQICARAGRQSVGYLAVFATAQTPMSQEIREAEESLRRELELPLIEATIDGLLRVGWWDQPPDPIYCDEFLFARSALQQADGVRALEAALSTRGIDDPAWSNLLQYLRSLAARIENNDQNAVGIAVEAEHFVRLIWSFLTQEALAEVAIVRLRAARIALEARGKYQLPLPPWWAPTEERMGQRWQPPATAADED